MGDAPLSLKHKGKTPQKSFRWEQLEAQARGQEAGVWCLWPIPTFWAVPSHLSLTLCPLLYLDSLVRPLRPLTFPELPLFYVH